ncbi:LysR family transcriptional regulator [Bacillus sp. AFS031507]|uniref:LysR family transcriptional regulator n=1 Tax=Bacillus sp. AFS031507 TaxID=2033496 RepID=UPI0015D4B926|nr:LysR family transcriptional regulator [Bacillus sp. AFS031507]
MDIDHLKTFVYVVELKSYSKTALVQHISQPTVSTRIRSLEDELGQKLLYRHGKEIQLTPAGNYFYNSVQKIIQTNDEIKMGLKEYVSDYEYSVGTTLFLSNYYLSEIIPQLREIHNDITLNIRTVSQPYQLIELFTKGIIDVAILSAHSFPNYSHQKLQSVELLWKEKTVLVVSPNHPLVGNVLDSCHYLSKYPLALLGTDVNHYSHQLIELCREENIAIKPEVATDNFEMAKRLVEKGDLISFLPYVCVENEIKNGQLVEIPYNFSRDLSASIYLFYRTDKHRKFFNSLYTLLLKSYNSRILP